MKTQAFVLVLAIVVFLFPVTLSGQTEKGSMFIGGTAGLQIGNVEYFGEPADDVTSISLLPQLGFFIADQLAIGGNVTIEYLSFYGESVTTVGIKPLVRYYFIEMGNAELFAQARIGYARTFFYGEGLGNIGFGIGAGMDAFIKENVALEILAGYDRTSYPEYEESYGGFGITFGFLIFL